MGTPGPVTGFSLPFYLINLKTVKPQEETEPNTIFHFSLPTLLETIFTANKYSQNCT
jgi:hypothetical protein